MLSKERSLVGTRALTLTKALGGFWGVRIILTAQGTPQGVPSWPIFLSIGIPEEPFWRILRFALTFMQSPCYCPERRFHEPQSAVSWEGP